MRQTAIKILDKAYDFSNPVWEISSGGKKPYSESLVNQLTNELRMFVRKHPEVPAGLLYAILRKRFSGKGYEQSLVEAAIGFAAKKAIEEIILWVEKKI